MHGDATLIMRRIEALVDRAPTLPDLEYHRLELIAARSWRRQGRHLPEQLIAAERTAAATQLAAPALLRRVREAAGGPLVVVKGPTVGLHYPDPSLREFRDLDLLVPDSAATQRELLSAGFREVGDPRLYEGIHHLRPLHWPGLPLVIEVHHSPKWLEHVTPPSTDALISAAGPVQSLGEGLLALPPAHHALLLAAHGWAHRPLSRLRDLLDVALVARAADPEELRELARDWGLTRMWRTTVRAAQAVLGDGVRPISIAVWARHLESARERTVLESHLQRWLGDLWGLPGDRLVAAASAVGADLVPEPHEGWPTKLARTRAAVGNAFKPKSQHDRMLQGEEEDDHAETAKAPARVA